MSQSNNLDLSQSGRPSAPDADGSLRLPSYYEKILNGAPGEGNVILPTPDEISTQFTLATEVKGSTEEVPAKWTRGDGVANITYNLGANAPDWETWRPPEITESVNRNAQGVLVLTDQFQSGVGISIMDPFVSDSIVVDGRVLGNGKGIDIHDAFSRRHTEKQYDADRLLSSRSETTAVTLAGGTPAFSKTVTENFKNGIAQDLTISTDWKSQDSANIEGHFDAHEQRDEQGVISAASNLKRDSSTHDPVTGMTIVTSETNAATVDRNSDNAYSMHLIFQTTVNEKLKSQLEMNYVLSGGAIISGTKTETGPDGSSRQVDYDPDMKMWQDNPNYQFLKDHPLPDPSTDSGMNGYAASRSNQAWLKIPDNVRPADMTQHAAPVARDAFVLSSISPILDIGSKQGSAGTAPKASSLSSKAGALHVADAAPRVQVPSFTV